jgi:hypothetical protein
MGRRGIDQQESLGDRDLELHRLDRPVEPLEFADPGLPVIGNDLHAAPLLRLRFDPIRIGQPAVASQRIERAFERVATNQRQNGIDPSGGETSCRFFEVIMLAIDHNVGPHLAYQLDALETRTRCEHARPAQLGELDGQRSDSAGSAVNDDAFAFLDVQGVIDALHGREPGGRDRAGVLEIEPLWNVRDLLARDGDVFGIEAAFGIGPAIGVDLVADLQPPHARAHGGNRSRAVDAQHQRKVRFSDGIPAFADVRVPGADARSVERDQHLGGVDGGHRQNVKGHHFGRAEMVNGGRLHGMRNLHRVPAARATLTSMRLGSMDLKLHPMVSKACSSP